MTIDTRIDDQKIVFTKDNNINLATYLNYLESKTKFYKTVTASAGSEWENERALNLADNNINSLWMSDRFVWRYDHTDTVKLDLKGVKNIGAIHLIYFAKVRAPTRYEYKCSQDNKSWISMGEFTFTPLADSIDIFNKVEPHSCRFVELIIKDSYGGDSPELAEIEAVESKYQDIDISIAKKVEENPFNFISSLSDLNLLNNYMMRNGLDVQMCFTTDKFNYPYCEPLTIFPNRKMQYSLIAPPNGTILWSIEMKNPPEIKTSLSNTRIYKLSLNDLIARNYIPVFNEK